MKLTKMLEMVCLLMIPYPTLSAASEMGPTPSAEQTEPETDLEEQDFVDVFDVAEQKLKEREQKQPVTQAPPLVTKKTDATPPLRIGGASTLGLGAAALIASAVTGGIALRIDNDLDETKCPDGQCFVEYGDDVDKRDNLALATNILVVAGSVTAVAGVLMIVFSYPEFRGSNKRERKAESVSVRPVIGRSFVGTQISWRF